MITIEVTQDDIDNGVSDNVLSCPIARAILRQMPNYKSVRATTYGIYLYNGTDPFTTYDGVWETPDDAVKFMRLFDRGEPVNPFSFTLLGVNDNG